MFAAMDTNKDGTIDLGEFQVHTEAIAPSVARS
jgi:hypothetical protein